MEQLSVTQTVPLTKDETGTIRVTGSRVTLDSVVHAFQRGATAEQIQDSFPALTLSAIYTTIAYYLEHQDQVEQYLQEQKHASEETQHEIESHSSSAAFRERIRIRQTQRRQT